MPRPRATGRLRACFAAAALLAVGLTLGQLSRTADAAAPTPTTPVPTATPSSAPTTSSPATSTRTVTATVSASPSTPGSGTVTVTVTATGPANVTTATAPPRTATVTRAPQKSGSQTSAAAILIALGVLLLAAVALWYYFAHRRGAGAHTTAAGWDAGLERLRVTARWFGGPATADLGGTTRSEATRSWGDARPIVVDLEHNLHDAQQAAPDPDRAARAQELAQAVAQLRAAIEADLRIRGADDAPGQEDRLRAAAERVNASRRRLDELLPAPPPQVTPGANPN